jgi:hypothetical protein
MEELVRGGTVVENVYHPVCPYQHLFYPLSPSTVGLSLVGWLGPFRCKGWRYGILVKDHLEPVIDAEVQPFIRCLSGRGVNCFKPIIIYHQVILGGDLRQPAMSLRDALGACL